MANEEHLAILKHGVEAWNNWRQGNVNVIPDLINADLRKVDATQGRPETREPDGRADLLIAD